MGCLARLLWLPVALSLAAGAAFWLWRMLPAAQRRLEGGLPCLRLGLAALAAGLVLFGFLPLKPLYVLGHELTHWLAAKLFRRPTGAFHWGLQSGSVAVAAPNGAIILAPYCIPFYFLLALGVLAFCTLVRPAWAADTRFQAGAALLLGLCYAYHLALTARALWHGQSDLRHCGVLLSLVFIIGCNLLVVDLLVLYFIHIVP